MNSHSNNYTAPDTVCNHPANDHIESVAFGFASREEEQLVLEHIATCQVCSQVFRDARFAAQALLLSLDEKELPESVWHGIEQRIDTAQPIQRTLLASPATPASPRDVYRVHWSVAAILALITLAAGILLGRAVFESEPEPTEVAQVEVSITDPAINASGAVHYFADQGIILLALDNLPAPPEGHVYQVWMIEGDTPVPMGVVDPNTLQFAAAGDPSQFDVLAVTVEEGPRGSDLPTTDPLVVADLAPFHSD